MAARKRLIQLPQARKKLGGSNLMNRLINQSFNECDMTLSQASAASAVSHTSLPNLKPVKVQAD
jgi:hypothetical protein